MKKLIYILALAKFILPFFLQNSIYEPHRDEFLYLAEARHMAWGYLELPPVLSFLSLITNFFGGSLFWIRFWPSLGGALTYVLVGRIILVLNGGRFALLLGFLPFVFGYFIHVHFILQPNFLEMLAWTAMAYGLISFVRSGNSAELYMAGAGFGLGMMSKYSVAFFAGCLLVGLVLTPQRSIFKNRHFYFALILGFVIFTPNLIWQGMHGWPIFKHMIELRHEQLDQVSRLNFIVDQLTYNLPGLICWGGGLYWVFVAPEGKSYRFIGLATILVLLFLVLSKGKSYYAMGAYPVLFACGAVCLENATQTYRGWRVALVGFSIITGCYIDMIAIPMMAPDQLAKFYEKHTSYRSLGFLRWEDQENHSLPQDFSDMLGWKEMSSKTSKIYHAIQNKNINKPVIDGANYGESASLDYYGRRLGMPPTIGTAASYLIWTPLDFYKQDQFILVTDYKDQMHDDFVKMFKSVQLADSITTPYSREYGTLIIYLNDPTPELRKRWSNEYEEARKEISIFYSK